MIFMTIWKTKLTLSELNEWTKNTLCDQLGIVFTEIGSDFLTAEMPVDARTHTPLAILHGGASAALAETVGSAAATLCVEKGIKHCVGLELNINHIRSVREGKIRAIARPLHLGKTTHVWDIRIHNEEDKIVSAARLTIAVIDEKKGSVTDVMLGSSKKI